MTTATATAPASAATAVDDLCTIEQQPSRFNERFGEMSPRAKVKVKGHVADLLKSL